MVGVPPLSFFNKKILYMGFHSTIPECNSGAPLFQFCFNWTCVFLGLRGS